MTIRFINAENRSAARRLLSSAKKNESARIATLKNRELHAELVGLVTSGQTTEDDVNMYLDTYPKSKAAAADASVAAPPPAIRVADPQTPMAPTQTLGQLVASMEAREEEQEESDPGVQEDKAARLLSALNDVLRPKVPAMADLWERIAGKVRALVRETMEPLHTRLDQMEKAEPRKVQLDITHPDGKRITLTERTHAVFPRLLKLMTRNISGFPMPLLLVGPSQGGKSTLGKQLAKALDVPFYSTGAVLTKYELLGFMPAQYAGNPQECPSLMTALRRAYEHGGVFVFDEVDASAPAALVAFNELISGSCYMFPDGMVQRSSKFYVLANGNTWGMGATAQYVGRNPIDASTRARFYAVEVGYDEDLERHICGGHECVTVVQAIRKAVFADAALRILVTPKHSLMLVEALAAGESMRDALNCTVFAGVAPDSRERALRAANQAEYI